MTAEVLDLAAIQAAGLSLHRNGVEQFPDGNWIARRPDGSAHVVFGYDEEDEQGQTWWTGTHYVDHTPADTFSYPTLPQLLDHVARVTRR